MQSFELQGHLTESGLAEIMRALMPDGFQVQFMLPGRRLRWDIKYDSPSGPVLVEYDGDEHYRNTMVIRADREKSLLAQSNGFKLVRFPYWLQLDSYVLKHFFQIEAKVVQDFPHGFITTKLFPASFCPLGLARFRMEMDSLPDVLREAVRRSLTERAAEYGAEYVVPGELRQWVE